MINRSEAIKKLMILNIPLDVDFSLSDIQSAYKLMAKLYHPDSGKSSNANDMMVKINNARDYIEEHFIEIKSFKLHLSSNNQSSYNNQQDFSKKYYQQQQNPKPAESERRRQAEEAERKRKASERA
ncbi:MAG: DnaJ domain-containing protein, partial [Candidatus Izemoplasmatales bacterium]